MTSLGSSQGPGDHAAESRPTLLDPLAERIDELHTRLLAWRLSLDDTATRLARLEGVGRRSRPPQTGTVAALAGRATQLAAAAQEVERRRMVSAGTAAAAAEQLIEAHADAGQSPAWLADVLDRFPGVDPGTLAHLASGPDASVAGMVSLLQGFRAEQLVTELVASDALPTPPDTQMASLASATNEKGWDLVLDTPSGPVLANVKATSDATAVVEHLRMHPDVAVVYATSDAAAGAAGAVVAGQPVEVIDSGDPWPSADGPVVVDLGVSSEELRGDVVDAVAGIDGADSGVLDEVLGALPLIGLGVVGGRWAYRWATTEDAPAELRREAGAAGKDVIINAGVGWAAAAVTGIDLLAAPTTIATGVLRAARRSVGRSVARVRAAHWLVHRVDAHRSEGQNSAGVS